MRFGAHVSISGSLDLAVDRALRIGCQCLQIFYGSPRQWRAAVYTDEVLNRFVDKRRASGLEPLIAHAAYLVNLAAPSEDYRRRSVASLLATVRGVERLDGDAAVTHLGSRLNTPRGRALRRVASGIREVLDKTARAQILLENSAGAGGTLGASFEDLEIVLDHLHGDPRVGVCLDTAHLFAAGWDLRTPAGVDAMTAAAQRAIGWQRIRLFHLNDSRSPLGSQVDRHENIGEGEIGSDGFRAIVNHPRVQPLPGIIETPGFDRQGPDRRNLARLARLQRRGRRSSLRGVAHGRPLH
ncbi:MAG: deoxyribonuclease IV [Armatimonadota bacterium]|nr:deoxyribonuclease IV [Armatimonadota bacterium]